MKTDKKLMATALALATLVGASAFAESRPSNETRRRSDGGDRIRRERSTEARRGDESRNSDRSRSAARGERERAVERSDRSRSVERGDRGRAVQRDDRSVRESDRNRSFERDRAVERNDRSFERNDRQRSAERNDRYGRNDRHDRDDRSRGSGNWRRDDAFRGGEQQHRGGSYGRGYGHRQPYHHRGRISKYSRHGHGYHVWVHGAPYPFFVPLSHWHRDRFRIGLVINIGGYYNPRGYYDYYDGYRGYDRSYSRGTLRGTVESVDYRRDTFVIRNDASGSFVTVVMRDRRRDLRPGDYVELYGDWTRSGLFTAYDVDLLDAY